MSPGFAVFILMNNYFHDVATAMLLACAIALRMVLSQAGESRDQRAAASFVRLYNGINRVAWFSMAWIVLSGIVRVATFREFEWANAVEKHHEAGLMAKYVLAFLILAAGAWLWHRTSNKACTLACSIKTIERG